MKRRNSEDTRDNGKVIEEESTHSVEYQIYKDIPVDIFLQEMVLKMLKFAQSRKINYVNLIILFIFNIVIIINYNYRFKEGLQRVISFEADIAKQVST